MRIGRKMFREGNHAPNFELPGTADGQVDTYSLGEAVNAEKAVLLLFYPFDFSPVCTNELCAIRDAEWFQFTPGLEVWGVSGDSTYAHDAFVAEYGLNFPLLSDYHATVAADYDVHYDEFENHTGVPKRAVFLIDPDQTVRYAWATDDAYEKPDFVPVKAALDKLTAINDSLVPEDVELEVDYEEEPVPQ
jgi:peroxiredoxin